MKTLICLNCKASFVPVTDDEKKKETCRECLIFKKNPQKFLSHKNLGDNLLEKESQGVSVRPNIPEVLNSTQTNLRGERAVCKENI